MKKIRYTFMVLIVIFGTWSLQAQEHLSMTTALSPGENFTFTVNYGAELDIDWGDGVYTSHISMAKPITGELKGQTVTVRGFDISLLDCSGQSLTALDVAELSSLTVLLAQNNQLETATLTNNKTLQKINLAYNQLATVSVSGLSSLTELIVNNNALTALTVSGNRSLVTLICNDNQIAALALTNLTRLQTLWCQQNELETLNLSRNTPLASLMCQNNQLTTLNVSGLKSLTDVWCNDNAFALLDLSSVESLVYLSADNAGIEILTYGNNEHLNALYLDKNSLGYAALLAADAVENYNYAPQNPLAIPANLDTDQTLDLSDQLSTADGVATNATFRWFNGENLLTAGEDYDENGGKFKFKKPIATLTGEISSSLFQALPQITTTQSVVVQGTGIKQTLADSYLSIAAVDGKLIIDSKREQSVQIYSIKGELMHAYDRIIGRIELQLPHGIYLVNNHKVVL